MKWMFLTMGGYHKSVRLFLEKDHDKPMMTLWKSVEPMANQGVLERKSCVAGVPNCDKHALVAAFNPLWKIWVRQLGWWLFPIYGEKKCSKPPTSAKWKRSFLDQQQIVLFTRSIFLFHPLLIPPNHARLDRFRFPRLVSIDFPFGPHLVRHQKYEQLNGWF